MHNNITELNIDEIESVNGGELTGGGIAAGIGTFVGGLGGTYFGVAAFALGPGFAAGVVGAVALGFLFRAIYDGGEAIL